MAAAPATAADCDAVHEWFGLSYASYLVLPRLVMQSMPTEWQERMVALLDECDDRFGGHYGGNDYMVKLRGPDGRFVSDPLGKYRHSSPLEPKAP